jgi:hypothetical protein
MVRFADPYEEDSHGHDRREEESKQMEQADWDEQQPTAAASPVKTTVDLARQSAATATSQPRRRRDNRGSMDGTRHWRKVVTFRNSLVQVREFSQWKRTRGRNSLLPWRSAAHDEHSKAVLAEQQAQKEAAQAAKKAKKAAKKAAKEQAAADKKARKKAEQAAKKQAKLACLNQRSQPITSPAEFQSKLLEIATSEELQFQDDDEGGNAAPIGGGGGRRRSSFLESFRGFTYSRTSKLKTKPQAQHPPKDDQPETQPSTVLPPRNDRYDWSRHLLRDSVTGETCDVSSKATPQQPLPSMLLLMQHDDEEESVEMVQIFADNNDNEDDLDENSVQQSIDQEEDAFECELQSLPNEEQGILMGSSSRRTNNKQSKKSAGDDSFQLNNSSMNNSMDISFFDATTPSSSSRGKSGGAGGGRSSVLQRFFGKKSSSTSSNSKKQQQENKEELDQPQPRAQGQVMPRRRASLLENLRQLNTLGNKKHQKAKKNTKKTKKGGGKHRNKKGDGVRTSSSYHQAASASFAENNNSSSALMQLVELERTSQQPQTSDPLQQSSSSVRSSPRREVDV